MQRIIEDASYKSLGENNGFAPNLLPGLNSYPQKLWETFNGN